MYKTDNTSFLTKLSSLPEESKEKAMEFIDSLVEKEKKKKTSKKKPVPKFGSMKGMFKMMPDFDEPLEDFKEYM